MAAAVVLAYTWQSIPYLRDIIRDSGVVERITTARTQVMDTIRSNPQALLGMTGAALTGSIGLIKVFKTRLTEFREARRLASETLGGITENFNTLKTDYDKLIGEKEELITEVTDLKGQLTLQAEQYGNIQNVLDAKNEEIRRLRDQTDDLHEVIKNLKLGDGEVIEKIKVM